MGNLTLTEDQFNEIYPDLQGHYNFFNVPIPHGVSKEYIERVYFKSKLWRMNNLYKVINKYGEPVVFRMNYAQHVVYGKSRQHPRVIILKSRQQGISTLWLISFFDDSVWCEHLTLGLMAQGTDEAATLLERIKFTWDHLSDAVKEFLDIRVAKDNTKEYSFSNNSTIFIRVSFRSATLQRLHISEYGKIANSNPKRAKETKTGTLQALAKGNTGIIESTAEGRNDFSKTWDSSLIALHSGQMGPKDFYPVFLSWLNDPDCVLDIYQEADGEARKYFEELEDKLSVVITQEQRNFWIAQRRELEGDIYQEYPATPEEAFTASKDGTYYSRIFTEHCVRKGKVQVDTYDPNLYTDVFFDLGVDDYFVMAFVQWYRGEWRIIDEYWNNGYNLPHYLEIAFERGYDIRELKMPHDIAVRELGSGNGTSGLAKSRYDIVDDWLTKNDHRHVTVTAMPKTSIEQGIEACRDMIPDMVIDAKCEYLQLCLLNYSKEWDDKLQVWKKTPVHDEFSHGADVMRSIALNTDESESSQQSKNHVDYSYRPRNTGHAV